MASSQVYHQRMTERIQATRMDGTISFAVPTTDVAAERYYTDPSPSNAEALVGPDLLEASRQSVGGAAEVRGVNAERRPRRQRIWCGDSGLDSHRRGGWRSYDASTEARR